MKKLAIVLTIIGTLIIVGVVSIFIAQATLGAKPPVGVVAGIRFNSRPSAIIRKLGSPIQVVDDMERCEAVYYSYETTMFDVSTSLQFDYFNDSVLTSVVANVSLSNIDDPDKLVDSWYQWLFNLYKDYEGFYYDKKPVAEGGVEIRSLGTETGAGGLTCFIENDGSLLRIHVIYME